MNMAKAKLPPELIKEANGRPTLAENDFGRRLHPSYGAMQLIEGWEGTKVAGGDLQEEQE